METITFKQGDIRYLTFYLKEKDITGTEGSFDLTNASTVNFKLQKYGETTLRVSGTCTIIDASNGKCRYQLDASNLPTGLYIGEIEVIMSDGQIATSEDFMLQIRSDLPV